METENKPDFIVAEVSKNWPSNDNELLSQKFEQVINVNLSRGYILKEWKINRTHFNGVLNETIIAIFGITDSDNKTEGLMLMPRGEITDPNHTVPPIKFSL